MSRRAGLALALGVVAFAAVTTIVGAASGAPFEFLAADLVLGLTFVAAGLAAAWLRPASPSGPMLLVSGALWFVGSYAPTLQPVVMHLGFAFEAYYDLVLAALLLILSSPRGALGPRWLIGLFAAATVVRTLGRLLLADPAQLGCDVCPPNPFVIWASVPAFEAVEIGSNIAKAAAAIGVGAIAVVRLRRGGPIWWRVRWPILLAGAVAMGAAAFSASEYAWTTATHRPLIELDEPWSGLASWLMFGARTLVPIGFLVATLQQRGAPGPVGSFAAGLERRDGGEGIAGALRTALGDPSLTLVVREPGGAWMTEDGSRTVSSDADRGRAVTVVGPIDDPVAEIHHDPALLEQPELLDAVVRVLHLALDNARLEAQVREQLLAVTASRERIVTAAEEERRRVERNLHDGAQQRLVAVTLALRRARDRAAAEGAPTAVRAELDAAADETSEAIRELRELARGIHPAVLEDAGLEAAVAGLARRSGIPVEVVARLDGRLPRLVESTAYFTIAEALTNAQRHAGASHATVRLDHVGDRVEIEIGDDGRGGADPERGSGLRGLADRVATLGGRLEVDSPTGRGTRIRATLPDAGPPAS